MNDSAPSSDFYQGQQKPRGMSSRNAGLIKRRLLYNIFMSSPALLCVLSGPDYIFELANDPYRQLMGDRLLTGKPLREAIPELNDQGVYEILDKVYSSGESYNGSEMPISFERKGIMEVVYLNFNCQAIYDDHERVEGILVFAYDVTEQVTSRNKIKESEAKYRDLISGLPFALYTCDAEGYVQLFNEAAVRLWGREPEIGKDLWGGAWKIFKTDGTPLSIDESPMAIALRKGIILNTEIVIRRPDGTQRNVIPYPRPIMDGNGKIIGASNSLMDITDQVTSRKQMEQLGKMIERLYMNAPAFICILKGPDFLYELVNPEYQKLYGNRELLGKKIIEATPELEGQGIIEKLEKVYLTGEPYVVTEKLLFLSHNFGKAPEATYLNFSFQPMYDTDESINGVLVFGYEVTGQVLVKKKGQEDLRKILESLPQITSASSSDGTNIFFNKFFFEYSGITREEATVNGWNSILHPDDIEDVLFTWEKCKQSGEDFYKEIRLRRKSDGMYRWHIAHLTAMKNNRGEVTQWIASATDIHEQKIKEQKKDEFISIASHEMKTPLTTAKAYLQLLEQSLEKDNEKANLYTKKAILSVERLKDLIAELLDVSKIQNGRLNYNFSTFDFNKMLEDAIESEQYNSPVHRIVRKGNIRKAVKGDKERLQQVIINLLSNAVKYSPESDEVLVHTEMENGQLKVSVKDSGIGIPRDKLEKVFERYFRVEGQEVRFQGLGIGLFISMEIILRHDGKLWVESEPGKGSTFYFTLPVK